MFFRAFLTKRHIFTQTKKFFGQTCDIIKLRQQGRGPDHPHEPANRRTKGGPPCKNRIVIFDLDGTIYQNSVFHRGYLRTLVAGTWAEPLEADLSGWQRRSSPGVSWT